jgi:single-strand DNA-binding protein
VNGEIPLTIVGNLTADPELNYGASGAARVTFTVASTPRVFDRQANEWKDGETTFMPCTLWREQGENAVESLTRGTRVIVIGRLITRSWETPEGEKRSRMELQVEEIGPSLRYATTKVTRVQRGGAQPAHQTAQAGTPAPATVPTPAPAAPQPQPQAGLPATAEGLVGKFF